ncbi:MAG: YdcF family protein [Lactobacillus sp.]|nr:YdcF family protein [Lactobacillus sp.]
MIYLNLVNELICALCWGITIRLILVRHLNSEAKVVKFNTFVFALMVINLAVVLPIFAFLLKNLPSQSVSWQSALIVTTIDVLSTFNLILFCVFSCCTRLQKCPPTVQDFLVLGAAVKHGQVPPVLATRLDKTIRCWKMHSSAKVIVSGGTVQQATAAEADVMAAYLIDRGIPAIKIVCETQALNTWQNLAFASQLIKSQETVVVTSDFHVLRARTYARKMGLNWSFVSSKTPWRYCPLTFMRDYLGIIRDHWWVFCGSTLLLLLVELILL